MTKEEKGYDLMFRALGDPHRLQILSLLRRQQMSGGELLELVDVVQSTLSHHMKTLWEAGLVEARKVGKRTYYSVAEENLRRAAGFLEALAAEDEETEKKELAPEPEKERPEAETGGEVTEGAPEEERASQPRQGKEEKKKKKPAGRDKPGKKEKKTGKKDKKKNKGKNNGKK